MGCEYSVMHQRRCFETHRGSSSFVDKADVPVRDTQSDRAGRPMEAGDRNRPRATRPHPTCPRAPSLLPWLLPVALASPASAM